MIVSLKAAMVLPHFLDQQRAVCWPEAEKAPKAQTAKQAVNDHRVRA